MIDTYEQLPEEGKKWYALACQQARNELSKDVEGACEQLEEVEQLAKQQGHQP